MATLGTEESGHCWEVETRVNVWTVHQKNGRVREVAISAGLTVHFITKDFLNVTQSYTCEGIQMFTESSHNFQEIIVVLWWKIFSCNAKWISTLTFAKLGIQLYFQFLFVTYWKTKWVHNVKSTAEQISFQWLHYAFYQQSYKEEHVYMA